MVDRPDHIGRIIQGSPVEDTPEVPVSPDLIDLLEKRFPELHRSNPGGVDGALYIICNNAQRSGELAVIGFLKTLLKGS